MNDSADHCVGTAASFAEKPEAPFTCLSSIVIRANLAAISPSLTHEFGNVLQAAGFELELIKNSLGDLNSDIPDNRACIALGQHLRRMSQLTAAWGVATSGETMPEFVDLGSIAQDIGWLVSLLCRPRHVELVVNPSNHPLPIRVNRNVFLHACLREVMAALSAVSGSGALRLGTWSQDGNAILEVQASGGDVPLGQSEGLDDLFGHEFAVRVMRDCNGRFERQLTPEHAFMWRFELPLAHR